MVVSRLVVAAALASGAAAAFPPCPSKLWKDGQEFQNGYADLRVRDVEMTLKGLGNDDFYRAVSFKLTNGFDGATVSCSGTTTTHNTTVIEAYGDVLVGTCEDTIMNKLTVQFTHSFMVTEEPASQNFRLAFDGDFTCQNSTHRP
jgi:hypothetical protein